MSKMYALVPVRVEISCNSAVEIFRAHKAVKNLIEFRDTHTNDGIWEADDAVIEVRSPDDTIGVVTIED